MYTWLKIIFGFLFISVVTIFAYFYWTTDYPIYTDPLSPNNYPSISWLSVIDGRLERSLQRQWREGKISANFDSSIFPESMQIATDGFYNSTGIRFISFPDTDVKDGKYKQSYNRPFKWISFYKTTIGKDHYYLLIKIWKNKDDSVSFLPYIIQDHQVTSNGQAGDYLKNLVNEDAQYFAAPIFEYKSISACIKDMGMASGYCNWLFRLPWRVSEYKKIVSIWEQTGILPGAIGRHPAPLTVKLISWEDVK